jgi:FMN phosphatase YigB (HAD superfamily)
MCNRLDVHPSRTVFIDDIGYNLKAARGVGMATIRAALSDTTGTGAAVAVLAK